MVGEYVGIGVSMVGEYVGIGVSMVGEYVVGIGVTGSVGFGVVGLVVGWETK
jgi:hypothetical protein